MLHRRTAYLAAVLTVVALGLAAVVAAWVVVQGGVYNVAATQQHWKPVYRILERAMEKSVARQARDIEPPPLGDARQLLQGAACYQDKCVQCHGAPGVAQSSIGQSMQPLPGPLMDATRRWQARELYWLTRHGIRMSGMPAWEMQLDEQELWAVVAFLEHLPELNAPAYADTVWRASQAQVAGTLPGCGSTTASRPAPAVGDIERGRRALYQKACNTCHVIPGITGPETHVGPPLHGYGQRSMVAGVLPFSRENLERWLMAPDHVKPGTAMPAMGISSADARDIAAYLADLR